MTSTDRWRDLPAPVITPGDNDYPVTKYYESRENSHPGNIKLLSFYRNIYIKH